MGWRGSSWKLRSLLPAWFAVFVPLVGIGVAWAFDVAEVESSVYKVYAFPAGKKGSYGFGTGFLVSGKRYVVTNVHVVEKNAEFKIAYRDANRQGHLVQARVYADRPQLDIAVLLAERDLPGKALTIGDYEPEKLTDVITMGFPGAAEIRQPPKIRNDDDFEAFLKDPAGLDATMTNGKVSRMNSASIPKSETRTLTALTVQHNAQFSPGNSGGPLFDECNAVIGINTFLSTNAQGLFFSIHSSELSRTLRELGLPFTSISKCAPPGPSLVMPIVIVLSATLALAALVLALRAGSLEKVGAQISRFSRMRRPPEPAAQPAPSRGNVLGSVPPAIVGAAGGSLQPVGGGRPLQLENGKALVLGRGRTSDLVVENDTVSTRHASLQFNGVTGRCTIQDLGSSNGTFLNGASITNGQATSGDVLRFGKAEFRYVGPPPMSRPAGGAAPAAGPARGWMLSGFDPSGRAVQLEMRPKLGDTTRTWTVGRDKARAQLVIDDSSVSGAHAELTFTAGQGLSMRDLGSTNGTRVDGQDVGTRTVNLKDTGQEIAFGAAKLRLSRLLS